METSTYLFVPDNCETLRCLCITDITDNFKYVASVSGRGGWGTRIFRGKHVWECIVQQTVQRDNSSRCAPNKSPVWSKFRETGVILRIIRLDQNMNQGSNLVDVSRLVGSYLKDDSH